jgi:hypothetical protein
VGVLSRMSPLSRVDPYLPSESRHHLSFHRIETMAQQRAILYPRGGAFNKLRSKDVFLERLLTDQLESYSKHDLPGRMKKDFIKRNIFDSLKANNYVFMIFDGDHPERGQLIQPNENEAYKIVFQKLRSMKKAMMAKRLNPSNRTKHVDETLAPGTYNEASFSPFSLYPTVPSI